MQMDSKPYKLVAVPTEPEELIAWVRADTVWNQMIKNTKDERDRVLGLFDLTFSRLLRSKGKGWRAELERLRQEIEYGHQQIPGTT